MGVFIDKSGRKWSSSPGDQPFLEGRRGVCGTCGAAVKDTEPVAPKPCWWHPPHPTCTLSEKHLSPARVQPFRTKRQRRQVKRAGKKARKMRR